ncbi:hypothetical protein FV290_09585, partial [Escherichia coli]
FGFAENTDDLFVGKTLLHGDVLMWLMKTLLTSGCTNQRGAGHNSRNVTNMFCLNILRSKRYEPPRFTNGGILINAHADTFSPLKISPVPLSCFNSLTCRFV